MFLSRPPGAETPLCIAFTSHVITEICGAHQQQEGFFFCCLLLIFSLMTTRVDIWGVNGVFIMQF